MPAITAYVAKLLIDAVVRAISVNANPSLPHTVTVLVPIVGSVTVDAVGSVVILAVAQFVIYAVSSFLSTLRNVSSGAPSRAPRAARCSWSAVSSA